MPGTPHIFWRTGRPNPLAPVLLGRSHVEDHRVGILDRLPHLIRRGQQADASGLALVGGGARLGDVVPPPAPVPPPGLTRTVHPPRPLVTMAIHEPVAEHRGVPVEDDGR